MELHATSVQSIPEPGNVVIAEYGPITQLLTNTNSGFWSCGYSLDRELTFCTYPNGDHQNKLQRIKSKTTNSSLYAFCIDDQHLTWSANNSDYSVGLYTFSITDQVQTTVFESKQISMPRCLVQDEAYVYWCDSGPRSRDGDGSYLLFRCPFSQCQDPELVAKLPYYDSSRSHLTIQGDYAYWANGRSKLYRTHIGGSSGAELLVSFELHENFYNYHFSTELILNGNHLYFFGTRVDSESASGSALFRCPPEACAEQVEQVLSGIAWPISPKLAGDTLSWISEADGEHRGQSCQLEDCANTLKTVTNRETLTVAVDEHFVYWTSPECVEGSPGFDCSHMVVLRQDERQLDEP